MLPVRKEIVTFGAGGGLAAVGLFSIPADFGYLLLTGGSTLISLSFGLIISQWRAEHSPTRGTLGKSAPSAPSTPTSPIAQLSKAPSTPSAPVAPSVESPEPLSPPTAPTVQKPSMTLTATPSPPSPTLTAPPQSTPSTVTSPPAPSPPSAQPAAPAYAAPAPPTSPSYEQPKPPGRKLPALKAPKIQLPKSVVENKVPVALLGAGLIVILAGLSALGVPPPPLVGIGLLIPGGLFFGLGAILLYQRLRPRVVEVVARRFCMHCGYEMSPRDVSCGRCHRQPPSGVDTKVCPNCTAVIPALAKFCKECGAGQPV